MNDANRTPSHATSPTVGDTPRPVGRRGRGTPTYYCPLRRIDGDLCGERMPIVGTYPDSYQVSCRDCGYIYAPQDPAIKTPDHFPLDADPHAQHRRERPVRNIPCTRCRNDVLRGMASATGPNADHQRRAAQRMGGGG